MTLATNETNNAMFCAELTRQSGEPQFGTAAEVKVWILLEYRVPWRAKAVTDNDLPQPIKDHLAAALSAVSGSRLVFIKQRPPHSENLRFYVTRPGEASSTLYEFKFDSLDDLLRLDLAAVAAGEAAFDDCLSTEPLFLVCTNGRRDKCCTKFGLPVYDALSDLYGTAVWQASHLGGHRYAPNVLCLPQAVTYGLMDIDEVVQAAGKFRQGKLDALEKFRGRSYYPAHIQAADFYLRRELALDDLGEVELVSADSTGEDRWLVRFRVGSQDCLEVDLSRSLSPDDRVFSCNAVVEKPAPVFQLHGVTAVTPG